MKRSTRLWTSALLLSSFGFVLASCGKDDDPAPAPQHVVYNISAQLAGANEVPATSSAGTGTATGTYDTTTHTLTYTVNWSGLTGPATAGHFHSPATSTTNASPLVFFLLQNNGNAGSASGSAQLSPAQGADLIAGKFYANIHTSANSGGEIRGMVSATR